MPKKPKPRERKILPRLLHGANVAKMAMAENQSLIREFEKAGVPPEKRNLTWKVKGLTTEQAYGKTYNLFVSNKQIRGAKLVAKLKTPRGRVHYYEDTRLKHGTIDGRKTKRTANYPGFVTEGECRFSIVPKAGKNPPKKR
ncbi:MAG: hypothetical protein V1676_01490 [Candidatus Diapherotrites archaeon]